MKRRKLLIWWTAVQAVTFLLVFFSLLLLLATTTTQTADAAIVPPPWSDPEKNPCASMEGGWQLLFWPPLKKCFKIFTIGYPCPESMELSPTATSGRVKGGRNAPAAECRCPPGTALSATTNKCHKIFKRGPCEPGQYFGPMPEMAAVSPSKQRVAGNRWGSCRKPLRCPADMIFWPQDGKCYTKFTKGPCIKGKLLVLNDEGLGECKCESIGDLRAYFYDAEETCHEHYTKGPCPTPGHLFLPGGRCDCQQHLPHYHAEHKMCFELNSPGPCPPGHIFSLRDNFAHFATANAVDGAAQCHCKDGYVPWTDGICYRLYTRGPCAMNEFLLNSTSCVRNFCGKSRLFFPDQKSCYRIGSQGPCALHQVVVFDFTTRPSIDGISYNGMCGCAGVIQNLDQQCSFTPSMTTSKKETDVEIAGSVEKTSICEAMPGMVELNGSCHKLYSQGPCGPGQWLEPLKTTTIQLLSDSKAKCVCRPGYTRDESVGEKRHDQRCNAPSVGLARYLTQHQQRQNAKLPSLA